MKTTPASIHPVLAMAAFCLVGVGVLGWILLGAQRHEVVTVGQRLEASPKAVARHDPAVGHSEEAPEPSAIPASTESRHATSSTEASVKPPTSGPIAAAASAEPQRSPRKNPSSLGDPETTGEVGGGPVTIASSSAPVIAAPVLARRLLNREITVPLAVRAAEFPELELTPEQRRAIDEVEETFVAQLGEDAPPDSEEYVRRWKLRQPSADMILRAKIGYSAFNQLQMTLYQRQLQSGEAN